MRCLRCVQCHIELDRSVFDFEGPRPKSMHTVPPGTTPRLRTLSTSVAGKPVEGPYTRLHEMKAQLQQYRTIATSCLRSRNCSIAVMMFTALGTCMHTKEHMPDCTPEPTSLSERLFARTKPSQALRHNVSPSVYRVQEDSIFHPKSRHCRVTCTPPTPLHTPLPAPACPCPPLRVRGAALLLHLRLQAPDPLPQRLLPIRTQPTTAPIPRRLAKAERHRRPTPNPAPAPARLGPILGALTPPC